MNILKIKSGKKALSLTELLITSVIMVLLIVPTIDVMSTMFASQIHFNSDVYSKQGKLNTSQRISSKLREGTYIYPSGTSLTIPTLSSSTSVTVEDNAIVVLVPTFDSDGDVVQPSTDVTSFKAVAYSIITEATWGETVSGNYAIVETIYDADLAVDSEDPLIITGTKPTDFSSGTSYVLENNLKPASFTTMGTDAFIIDGDLIKFAFVPREDATYFPGSGSLSINDQSNVTSINVRNVKD